MNKLNRINYLEGENIDWFKSEKVKHLADSANFFFTKLYNLKIMYRDGEVGEKECL